MVTLKVSSRKFYQASRTSSSGTIEKGKILPKVTVGGIEYNTEDLSENGKARLASLQFIEVQMNKLK